MSKIMMIWGWFSEAMMRASFRNRLTVSGDSLTLESKIFRTTCRLSDFYSARYAISMPPWPIIILMPYPEISMHEL